MEDAPAGHRAQDGHPRPLGEVHRGGVDHQLDLPHRGRAAQPQPVVCLLELQRKGKYNASFFEKENVLIDLKNNFMTNSVYSNALPINFKL